jgi:hypothetical protein
MADEHRAVSPETHAFLAAPGPVAVSVGAAGTFAILSKTDQRLFLRADAAG